MSRILLDQNSMKKAPGLPEERGSREKFWLTFNDNPNEKWLFKKTNNLSNDIVTYEDIGEVVFNKICNKTGIPCCEYKLATYINQNGEKIDGVISKNFNPKNLIEYSGFSILEYARNFVYDNFNGKIIPNNNTLKNYLSSLGLLNMNNDKLRTKINVNEIFLNMQKMFIVDYLCGQSDRNWNNIGFMFDPDKQELVMSPLYDNGNIFCWNFRKSVIKHQHDTLAHKFQYRQLQELYRSKTMALGIKTPLTERDPNYPTLTKKIRLGVEEMDNLYNTVNNELVDMISDSPELSKFLFENFSPENSENLIKVAFDEMDNEYGENYTDEKDLLKNQSSLVFKLKSKFLCEKVKEMIEEKGDYNENNL